MQYNKNIKVWIIYIKLLLAIKDPSLECDLPNKQKSEWRVIITITNELIA
jgi:hypothetical protein